MKNINKNNFKILLVSIIITFYLLSIYRLFFDKLNSSIYNIIAIFTFFVSAYFIYVLIEENKKDENKTMYEIFFSISKKILKLIIPFTLISILTTHLMNTLLIYYISCAIIYFPFWLLKILFILAYILFATITIFCSTSSFDLFGKYENLFQINTFAKFLSDSLDKSYIFLWPLQITISLLILLPFVYLIIINNCNYKSIFISLKTICLIIKENLKSYIKLVFISFILLFIFTYIPYMNFHYQNNYIFKNSIIILINLTRATLLSSIFYLHGLFFNKNIN